MKELSKEQSDRIRYSLLPKAFNPHGPISQREMFKGRSEQIEDSLDAIFQPNEHLVIIGERGVGKSSLANIIFDLMKELGTKVPGYWYGKVNCGQRETFTTLWKTAFRNVRFTKEKQPVGFRTGENSGETNVYTLNDTIQEKELTPSRIVTILQHNSGVWIFDEFNMLPRHEAQPFADLIKAFSDASSQAKIILVGVAESLSALLEDHRSIDRSIRQILMPRMDSTELREIIEGAQTITELKYTEPAQNIIVNLSQGLPYFTHQLGLCAAKVAIEMSRPVIDVEDVKTGIEESLRASEESLTEAYRLAVHSQRPKAIYKEVLLACALADKDPFGYFKQADIVDSLSRILNRKIVPGAFAYHLSTFSSTVRGRILMRKGYPRNYVYRFSNSLLQPYAIMHGLVEGVVTFNWIGTLKQKT